MPCPSPRASQERVRQQFLSERVRKEDHINHANGDILILASPGKRCMHFSGCFLAFEKAEDQPGKGIARPGKLYSACQVVKEGAFQETENE